MKIVNPSENQKALKEMKVVEGMSDIESRTKKEGSIIEAFSSKRVRDNEVGNVETLLRVMGNDVTPYFIPLVYNESGAVVFYQMNGSVENVDGRLIIGIETLNEDEKRRMTTFDHQLNIEQHVDFSPDGTIEPLTVVFQSLEWGEVITELIITGYDDIDGRLVIKTTNHK